MTTELQTAPARDLSSDLPLLIGSLALASTVELAILRTFTRTAIHIPALHSLQEPYRILTAGGEYAYFVAVALVVPAFAALCFHLFHERIPVRHLAMFGLLLFVIPSALSALNNSSSLALDSSTVTSVLVLSAAIAISIPVGRAAIPVACFGGAFAMSGAYTILPSLSSVGVQVEQPAWLLDGTEFLGVAFAVSSPLLLGRDIDRHARWSGLVVGVLVLVMFLGNGSTSRFLLLWNVGLSGIFPGVVYAAAAAALTVTVVGLMRSGSGLAASGLLLLVTGGLGLHSTYQSALVVAGLTALCCGLQGLVSPGVRSKNSGTRQRGSRLRSSHSLRRAFGHSQTLSIREIGIGTAGNNAEEFLRYSA